MATDLSHFNDMVRFWLSVGHTIGESRHGLLFEETDRPGESMQDLGGHLLRRADNHVFRRVFRAAQLVVRGTSRVAVAIG